MAEVGRRKQLGWAKFGRKALEQWYRLWFREGGGELEYMHGPTPAKAKSALPPQLCKLQGAGWHQGRREKGYRL